MWESRVGRELGVGTVAVLLAEKELVLLWLTRQWRGFWTGCTNGCVFSVLKSMVPCHHLMCYHWAVVLK